MTHSSLWSRLEPVFLLFAAGGFIGLIFPLAQFASAYGISPIVYAAISAAGAALVLLSLSWMSGHWVRAGHEELRYAAFASLLTYSIPFGTLIAIIPLIGTSVPAVFQSLIPIITLGIAFVMGVEKPSLLRSAGLALGLVGVLLVLYSKNNGVEGSSGTWIWYAAALITPISLSFGNVYRTTAWPKGSHSLPLAVLTMASAAVGLLLLMLILVSAGLIHNIGEGLAQGWHLLVLQSLFTGMGYSFLFRLQHVGGPVYVSQISYVITGVGIVFAVTVFSEQISLAMWVAAALIFTGIALVTVTRSSQPKR